MKMHDATFRPDANPLPPARSRRAGIRPDESRSRGESFCADASTRPRSSGSPFLVALFVLVVLGAGTGAQASPATAPPVAPGSRGPAPVVAGAARSVAAPSALDRALAARPVAGRNGADRALLARLDGRVWVEEDCFGVKVLVPAALADRLAEVDAALRPCPDAIELHRRRARLLEDMGDEAGARSAWIDVLRVAADKASALEELSAFEGRRLRWADAAAALDRAVGLSEGENRRRRLEALIELVERQAVDTHHVVELLRRLVAASPGDGAVALRFVDALKGEGRLDEALSEARRLAEGHPDRWNELQKRRSDWLLEAGRPDEALAVHRPQLDMLRVGNARRRFAVDETLELLRKTKRHRARRRALRIKAGRGELDEAELVLLVAMRRRDGRSDEAEKVVLRWVEARKEPRAVRMGGLLLAELGRAVAAQRLLLAASIGASPAERDELGWEIFRLLDEHPGAEFPLVADRLRDWIDGDELDGNPGAVPGVLSLAFNEIDFSARGRALDGASRVFFTHAYMAELAEVHRRTFPDSPHLDEMDRRLFHVLRSYEAWAEAVTVARRIVARGADAQATFEMELATADCWFRAGKADEAFAVYERLLASDLGGDAERRQQVFDRAVRAYMEHKRHGDALRLHRLELERHPDDPKAYDRFLRFATRYRMVGEELAIYERAIRQFDDRSWFHRLARWSLRQKKQARFRALVDEVKKSFSASELGDFLSEFIRYRWKQKSHPDSRYFLELHRFAYERFPTDLRFARALAGYHAHFEDEKALEALRLRHAVQDRTMRRALLTSWSRDGSLGRHLAQVEQSWKDFDGRAKVPGTGAISAGVLMVEGLVFHCRPEEALEGLRRVTAHRPAHRPLLEMRADLARSLGEVREALEVWSTLRGIAPGTDEYRVLPGESLVDAHRHDEAIALWKGMLEKDGGREERFLELATLFWDYFLFDEALDVLRRGRTVLGRPSAFRKAVGAIHESRQDWASAVEEYVATLVRDDPYDWTARERLAHLAGRRGQEQAIRKAFAHAAVERPDDMAVVRAHAAFLEELGDRDGMAALYEKVIDVCDDGELLDTMAGFFGGRSRQELRGRCLRRAAELADWEGRAVRRWAGWLEERGRLDEAAAVWQKEREALEGLREDEPERLARQFEAESEFLWRNGRHDPSLARLAEAIALDRGPSRQRMEALRARRLIELGRDDEARTMLGELLTRDPFNAPCFSALAQLQVRAKDVKGLRSLYHEKIAQLARAKMDALERRNRIVRLRLDVAADFERLGAKREAVDELIEVINAEPPAPSATARAWQIAAGDAALETHLLRFYEKTAAVSHKDHRWPLVLARFHELAGRLDLAVDWLGKAIAIVPQRVDVRREHVDLLERLGRFDEAAKALRELHGIDGDSVWLLRIADALARAGEIDEAVKVVGETLVGRPVHASRHLAAARRFWSWGRVDEALNQARSTQNRYKDEYLDLIVPDDGLGETLRIFALGRGFDAALEALRQLVDFGGYVSGEARTYWAKSRVRRNRSLIEEAARRHLAPLLVKEGRQADRAAVQRTLLTWFDAAPEMPREVFDRHLAFARAAGLAGLEEIMLRRVVSGSIRLGGPTWSARARRQALAAFYERQERWDDRARELEALAGATGRVPEFRSDMASLVELRRLTGDEAKELEALRRLWTGLADGGHRPWDAQRRRFYELLLDGDRFEELEKLTAESDLVFANVAIERGHWRLAEVNLTNAYAERSPLWRESRRALLKAAAGDAPQEVAPLFDSILGLATVGESLGRKPDPRHVAGGGAWTVLAAAYGDYLGKTERRQDARALLRALVEARPRNATAWVLLARGLVGMKRAVEAAEACESALVVWPRDPGLIDALVDARLAAGDRPAARAACMRLLWSPRDRACIHRCVRRLRAAAFRDEARELLLGTLRAAWPEGERRELTEDLRLLFEDETILREPTLEALRLLAPERLDRIEMVLDSAWLGRDAQRRWLGLALGLVEARGQVQITRNWETRLARRCDEDEAWTELRALATKVLGRRDFDGLSRELATWEIRLATACHRLGATDEAEKALARMEAAVGPAEARANRIAFYTGMGLDDAAWELRVLDARESLRRGDRDGALQTLARAALRKGAFAEAAAHLERRAQAMATDRAWFEAVDELVAARAWREVLPVLDHALRLDGATDEGIRIRGRALFESGRRAEGTKLWIALFRKAGVSGTLRMALVEDLVEAVTRTTSLADMEGLLPLRDGAPAEDRFLAGRLLVAAGRGEEGMELLVGAAAADPADWRFQAWLAVEHMKAGRTREAALAARTAWQSEPGDPQVAALLAKVWAGEGRHALVHRVLAGWLRPSSAGTFVDALRGRDLTYRSWVELDEGLVLPGQEKGLASLFLVGAASCRQVGATEEARDLASRVLDMARERKDEALAAAAKAELALLDAPPPPGPELVLQEGSPVR